MLATDPDDVIQQLTGVLNSANGLSLWAQTLVNAVLPPMNPEPAWYSDIDAKIKENQACAKQWLDKTAPSIVSDMTTSFIEYNGHFKNVVKDILPTLADVGRQGNIPTAAQTKVLVELLGVLQQEAQVNVALVKTHLDALDEFSSEMDQNFVALKAALDKAMPEEANELALIQQVQTQLQSAEISLAQDNQAATDATVNSQTSMISLVVGMTFALGFSPFSFGVALLALSSTVISDIKTQARVASDLKQIELVAKNLSEDKMQLGLLQGVISNLNRLEAGIQAAQSTFDDFDDTWSFANYGLSYLLVVLDQPQIDISKIPDLNELPDAVSAWQKVHDFAMNVQGIEVTALPNKTISAST